MTGFGDSNFYFICFVNNQDERCNAKFTGQSFYKLLDGVALMWRFWLESKTSSAVTRCTEKLKTLFILEGLELIRLLA